jgi:hypothetical protein
VEALLMIAASDDTIAAMRAANTNPLMPGGTNRSRSQGYASSGLAIIELPTSYHGSELPAKK